MTENHCRTEIETLIHCIWYRNSDSYESITAEEE